MLRLNQLLEEINMKNIAIFILSLGICIIGFLFIKEKKINKISENRQNKIEKQIQVEAKEIAKKVDEKGIETIIYEVTKNKVPSNFDPTKLSDNSKTKGLIDTTAMALDIRTKQLQEIRKINASLIADNLKLKSINGKWIYESPNLNASFYKKDNDTVYTADIRANVAITEARYHKSTFFGKKQYLGIKTTDSLFRINNVDYLEFEQIRPKFSIKGQATATYDLIDNSYGFGPAIKIEVGRLAFKAGNIYYPVLKTWKPQINATYNIFDF